VYRPHYSAKCPVLSFVLIPLRWRYCQRGLWAAMNAATGLYSMHQYLAGHSARMKMDHQHIMGIVLQPNARGKLTQHRESKNRTLKLLPMTSPSVNRFSQFVRWHGLSDKFANKLILKYPTTPVSRYTIPCEIWMSEKLAAIWNMYCD